MKTEASRQIRSFKETRNPDDIYSRFREKETAAL